MIDPLPLERTEVAMQGQGVQCGEFARIEPLRGLNADGPEARRGNTAGLPDLAHEGND